MKNRIEIHIIAYNEHTMLPFTIAHYRRMFKDPMIVVHDNFSTDDTVQIAEKEGCIISRFATDGMNDNAQSRIKSQAAINATCEWVLCIDADEECFINDADLEELEVRGINIVEFDGWNIFDQVASPWDIKIPMGVPCVAYSKPVLLRTGVFNNVAFAAGAHSIILGPFPGKKENRSKGEYKLLHYKHWSCDYNINRSAELGARQSEDNLKHRHSFHFAFPRETHESYFNSNYEQRQIIVDKRIIYPEGFDVLDLRPNLGEVLIGHKKDFPNG